MYQLVDIYVASAFWLLCIILLWTSMYTNVFSSLGYITGSEIFDCFHCKSHFHCKFSLSNLWQQLSHITFPQQHTSVPISPHPYQHIIFCLFDSNHSSGCKVLSNCGSDLHFQIISDVEYLFIYFWVICISSLKKCLFKYLVHFFSRIICLLLLIIITII